MVSLYAMGWCTGPRLVNEATVCTGPGPAHDVGGLDAEAMLQALGDHAAREGGGWGEEEYTVGWGGNFPEK